MGDLSALSMGEWRRSVVRSGRINVMKRHQGLIVVPTLLLSGLLLAAAVRGGGDEQPSDHERRVSGVRSEAPPQMLQISELPNACRIHPWVISGGQPEGAAGFEKLQALGVKTVISVDGAKPNLDLAAAVGLRYIHLPHGYDGIPSARRLELAKAVSECEPPLYIHCHHGKHRSPAAAAVACLGADLISPSVASKVLELAGTNPDYRGLHRVVAEAQPITDLENHQVEFHASIKVPPIAQSMVQLELSIDRLRKTEAAGWQTPDDHPDLSPSHEALMLREQLTELLRTDAVKSQPPRFLEILRRSRDSALRLESALKAAASKPSDHGPLTETFKRIRKDCVSCHRQFRNGA